MIHDYIFDVDGTLTPSRGTIDPQFEKEFLCFARRHRVFLVTGSDRPKTLEQVGESVYNACVKVYNCSGNDVYMKDNRILSSVWKLPKQVRTFFLKKLAMSPYPHRSGLHFENRTGMCNFSVVGRNADNDLRKDYYEYDCQTKEREQIALELNEHFPYLQVDVGGETGIDIFNKGCNKAQILKEFGNTNRIKFYGDRTDPSGNDYHIAIKLNPQQVYAVTDWQHTRNLLMNEELI